MPFDYEANINAIINTLNDANTTTAVVDLSNGLTTRVKNIYKNDPGTVSIREDSYPCVFVRISNKNEDFASLGITGPSGNKKRATCVFDVIGLYHKDGAITSQSNVLNEVYKLAGNIEGVFQQEITLSQTALWCSPKRTEFFGPFQSEGVMVKGVLIELEGDYLFR